MLSSSTRTKYEPFRLNIEIINTGSELMLGYVLNTHQQWMCRTLSQAGYQVNRQVAVPDTGSDIQQAVKESLSRADIILTTGGLGPTSDDITRELIAQLLGLKLVEDPAVVARIEGFFAQRKRVMPQSTRVQAQVPQGAQVLHNPNGTAPGLLIQHSRTGARPQALIMLPGPPRELRPMMTDQVLPWLKEHWPVEGGYACRVLKTVGIGESYVEELIAPSLQGLVQEGLDVGYCARVGEVEVRFVSRKPNASEVVSSAEAIATRPLREWLYGYDEDILEKLIVSLLSERQETLSLAESCTGGFIANRITNVPGASKTLLSGLVTYSNAAKQKFLGVKSETLESHGAVSEQTVRQMAEGARRESNSTYAISVSGIAGPDGGTPEKPVGTVWIALASPDGTEAIQRANRYDRETFKYVTSQQALDLLRRALLKRA